MYASYLSEYLLLVLNLYDLQQFLPLGWKVDCLPQPSSCAQVVYKCERLLPSFTPQVVFSMQVCCVFTYRCVYVMTMIIPQVKVACTVCSSDVLTKKTPTANHEPIAVSSNHFKGCWSTIHFKTRLLRHLRDASQYLNY